MTRKALAAIVSVAVIAGVAGCGASDSPQATSSTTSSAATATSQPTPTAGTTSACADLGGTIGGDQICRVHTATPESTIDLKFPVDYPDQQAVSTYLKHERDHFVAFVKKYPQSAYLLDITGTEYRSGTDDSGTQSLLFESSSNTGAAHQGHPDTNYQAFNYDLSKRAPITIDTLFTPGVDPLAVLSEVAEPKLEKHFGAEVVPALRDAGLQAYEDFAITDDSVLFSFGESQLLVSNMGPYQVAAPRSRLESMLAIPHVDPAPPCSSGQVDVSASKPQAAAGHRGVMFTFALKPGAAACTLTGYPGVDSGAGGPLIHAKRTDHGYMGGVRDGDPTTVTVSPMRPTTAVIEGGSSDASGNRCPTYTDFRVTVPDTDDTVTVTATLDTCELQVHPIGSDL